MFVDVIPQRPLPFGDGCLTFSVPQQWQSQICVGQMIAISLRGQREKGIVLRMHTKEPEFETIDIGGIITPPLLDKVHFDFLQRVAEYNFCRFSKVLPLFLSQKIWQSDGLPPTERFLQFVDSEEAEKIRSDLRGKKQQAVVEILLEADGKMAEDRLRERGDIALVVIKNLLEKGVIKRTLESFPTPQIPKSFPAFPSWTDEQQQALDVLEKSQKNLVFGPAGSGKTLLALQQIADVIAAGKTALFLMPERFISEALQQTIARYFPEDIFALYHSFLAEGEKQDIWWKVREGRVRIIFGTRAALFLPFQKLGIVVVDEEHDTSFKSDQTPRYHARQAAEQLVETHDAKLVLQSATPSMESFTRATGKTSQVSKTSEVSSLQLVQLHKKFGEQQKSTLHIVDLRNELAARNFSPFSYVLQNKIQETLNKKRQVLLFLNRRGKHSALVCRQCGNSTLCSHCQNRSTLHEDRHRREFLLCHHCGHIDRIPPRCPRCQSTALKGFGIGTQELEREVKRLFPQASVVRADRDSTAQKNASLEIFEEFAHGHADILIGTQIVSKGLDLPNIGLVGIVLADSALHLPDFRASEYAFQLLMQVAGRTGRQGRSGEVVLQTYLPEHPAIQFCAEQDYEGFFQQEMKERRELSLPPEQKMIRLIFVDRIEKKAFAKAQQWKKKLDAKAADKFSKEQFTISLAPAMNKRKFGKFHYHIFITGAQPQKLLEGEELKGVRVDRDPVESF